MMYHWFLKFLIISSAQLNLAFANAQDRPPSAEGLTEKIQGTWVLESNSSVKLEFNDLGELKQFENGKLISTELFKITSECGGENLTGNDISNRYFLKTYQKGKENEPVCAYLEGVDYKGNGFLSLMTQNQGRIIVYKKEEH